MASPLDHVAFVSAQELLHCPIKSSQRPALAKITHNTHTHTHTRMHMRTVETTQHPFLPAFLWLSQSSEGKRRELSWGHLEFVLLLVPPLPFSASFEADSPKLTTPFPNTS